MEGTALYFGGADARQAVTVDLDLRGAKLVLHQRFSLHQLLCYSFFLLLHLCFHIKCILNHGFINRFVEYWARIGSEDNMTLCHRPTCRKEGVLLDYSTDGGAMKTCFLQQDIITC